MSREIVVWCDVCLSEDVRASAETLTLSVDGRGPLALDLCPAHRDQYVKPLLELLVQSGQRVPSSASRVSRSSAVPTTPTSGPKRRATSASDYACPFCDRGQGLRSNGGLATHLASAHGAMVSADGKAKTATVFGETCPVCGTDGWTRLGHHTARAHDLTAAQAFAEAAALGDPHGVYARVRATLPA
jgi:hypothetical protein